MRRAVGLVAQEDHPAAGEVPFQLLGVVAVSYTHLPQQAHQYIEALEKAPEGIYLSLIHI